MKVRKYPDPWMSPKVELRDSTIHGMGMFAIADISEGERLIVWSGECYTDRKGAEKAKSEGKGFMQWDDDVFSVETEVMEDLYRVNHSCDPNVWMSDAHTVIARRDIPVGVEIVIDYSLLLFNDTGTSSFQCNCGSDICRGEISDENWKDPELQDRYRGHFSPWLNKMIDFGDGA
jgi:SET domain-containing protein